MLIRRIMSARVVLLCFALMLVWQVSAVRSADQGTRASGHSYQKEALATVGAVQGDGQVQRAGEAKFKRIGLKSPLYLMDFVATDRNSKLWWRGTFNAYSPSDKWQPSPDVTHGSLGAESVFGFKQFERAGASYRFVGYVQKGSVRFIKTLPNTNPPSTFIIGTHTAWIEVLQSDRAADFIVESKNESLTTVTVLWGKVRVRNVSPEIKESRILTSCQEVDVERNQEPGDIKWVSTDTMKELVKRTTIPKTLPEDVPSCERLKTEVILDLTEVYLPPPGVALYPAIVPVPVPVPGDKAECCPPGKTYDPRTGQCVCPCPEGERPPVTVLGTNGSTGNGPIGPGPCESCRRGATFNQQTCSCECPCPQGFLLPGQGCVPQCPAGYSEAYDASNSPPYRCLYCVPTGIVTDPIPPPLRQCQNREQCDRCESCIDGTCVPITCGAGLYLDRVSCACVPATNNISTRCAEIEPQCPACQRCVNGQCQRVVTCPDEQRLNQSTCQCEPLNGTVNGSVQPRATSEEPTGCRNNSDCGEGEVCRQGKCVKKPPPVSRPLGRPDTFTQPFVEDPSIEELRRDQGISVGPPFGTGIGGGGFGGGQQLVPRTPPQRIAPVKPQVPRKGKPN